MYCNHNIRLGNCWRCDPKLTPYHLQQYYRLGVAQVELRADLRRKVRSTVVDGIKYYYMNHDDLLRDPDEWIEYIPPHPNHDFKVALFGTRSL